MRFAVDRLPYWILVAVSLAVLLPAHAEDAPKLTDPLCPSGVRIVPRIDARSKQTHKIVKETWITHCYMRPLTIYEEKPKLPKAIATRTIRWR